MKRVRFRCHHCGEESTSEAAANRHADAEHHTRYEVLLFK